MWTSLHQETDSGKTGNELRAGMSAGAKAASAAEHRRLVEEMSLLSGFGKRGN
jgi:hypothetical protein